MTELAGERAGLRVNPSLEIEAQFQVSGDAEERRASFNLADCPELCRWLETFIDHALARQGLLEGDHPIGRPPGGDTLQTLLRARVILTRGAGETRSIALNPGVNIALVVKVRLAGEPARHSAVGLRSDPEFARWLLHFAARKAGEFSGLQPAVQARMRELGVLTGQRPPDPAFYPDPADAAAGSADFAVADAWYLQPAGASVPPAVAEALGPHGPRLPPDCAIAWLRDAGTGIVLPAPAPVDGVPPARQAANGTAAADRAAEWQARVGSAQRAIRASRYVHLQDIIAEPHRERLRRYVRRLDERGYFPPLGDGQVELRTGLHNEPAVASMHHALAMLVSRICGEPLIGSYCYLARYEAGAVLERHRDRPQCRYNLSVTFDVTGPGRDPEPWPIWLQLDRAPVAVNLDIGDGLLYSGTDIWHWRDALPDGHRAFVCFYHFVQKDFTGTLY